MRSPLLFTIFLLQPCFMKAQNIKGLADSLEKKYAQNHADTTHVYLLICKGYIHPNADTTLLLTQQALALAQKIDWAPGIAKAYRQLGVLKETNADYSGAIDANELALKAAGPLHDDMFNGSIYNNTGKIFMKIGELDKALGNFESFFQLSKKMNSMYGQAIALLNIGNVYLGKNNLNKALEKFKEDITLAEKNHFTQIAAYCYANAGVVLNRQQQYTEALSAFNKSVDFANESGDISILAESFNGISEAMIFTNRHKEAEPYARQALQLSTQAGNYQYQKEAYEMLSDIFKSRGNYDSALVYYKSSITAKDSLISEEKKVDVIKKQMKLESDKKELVAAAEINRQAAIKKFVVAGAGILFLASLVSFIFYKKRRDAKQKQQEAELKITVADTEMKALRAQMNPHFIFNSLNSISDYIAKNDVPLADKYLTKFAKLMRMILENSEQKDVPLASDLKALELYMQLEALRMNNKFTYEIRVGDDIDTDNTLIPPLILQPFVENSIWHGIARKEGKGIILIEIKKENNSMINCIVQDDGIGRKQSAAFKTAVPEKEEKTSLGMKITQARIDILNRIKNAKAAVTLSDLEEGVRVEVRLPLTTAF